MIKSCLWTPLIGRSTMSVNLRAYYSESVNQNMKNPVF